MGGRYLTDLADVCRGLGLTVHEESGWQSRGRSSGGYSTGPVGTVIHHTASPASWDGQPDVDYCTYGSDIAPICGLYLGRRGEVWVCAGGATNHAGSGGPHGSIPQDSANGRTIGIEAGNDGIGEPWPDIQQQVYVILARGLQAHYRLAPTLTVAHWEWAPSRKIDPAGASRWASGAASWNMGAFRADVAAGWPGAPTPPTPQPPSSSTHTDTEVAATMKTIRKGDTGTEVVKMQHLLAAGGYLNAANPANYDGVWGAGTDGAKVLFDQAHGLYDPNDTSCGPKSWESLMNGRKW